MLLCFKGAWILLFVRDGLAGGAFGVWVVGYAMCFVDFVLIIGFVIGVDCCDSGCCI